VRIKAFRLRGYSPVLRCDVSRIVGYYAECDCGARSKLKRSHASLRALLRDVPLDHVESRTPSK
jgi:hypothetical protein